MRIILNIIVGFSVVLAVISGSPTLAKTRETGQRASKMERIQLKAERKREDRLFRRQRKEQRRLRKEEDRAFRQRHRRMHTISFQQPTSPGSRANPVNFGQRRSALAHRQNIERRLFFHQQLEQRKLEHARGMDRRALAFQQHQQRSAFLNQQRAQRMAIRPHR